MKSYQACKYLQYVRHSEQLITHVRKENRQMEKLKTAYLHRNPRWERGQVCDDKDGYASAEWVEMKMRKSNRIRVCETLEESEVSHGPPQGKRWMFQMELQEEGAAASSNILLAFNLILATIQWAALLFKFWGVIWCITLLISGMTRRSHVLLGKSRVIVVCVKMT